MLWETDDSCIVQHVLGLCGLGLLGGLVLGAPPAAARTWPWVSRLRENARGSAIVGRASRPARARCALGEGTLAFTDHVDWITGMVLQAVRVESRTRVRRSRAARAATASHDESATTGREAWAEHVRTPQLAVRSRRAWRHHQYYTCGDRPRGLAVVCNAPTTRMHRPQPPRERAQRCRPLLQAIGTIALIRN